MRLLIHRCNIQEKTVTGTYEKTVTWTDISTNVPCRHNSDTSARISDGEIRINTDDDKFFFLPTQSIKRGNRIVYDGDNYDVIKVNKLFDSEKLHHLEVRARYTDNE